MEEEEEEAWRPVPRLEEEEEEKLTVEFAVRGQRCRLPMLHRILVAGAWRVVWEEAHTQRRTHTRTKEATSTRGKRARREEKIRGRSGDRFYRAMTKSLC